MATIGRPRTCDCGDCTKCKNREANRARWNSLTLEERRAIIARRDPEKRKITDVKRYYRHSTKRLAAMKVWAANNRERVYEAKRLNDAKFPDRYVARYTMGNAIRDGRLTRGTTCEDCGVTGVRINGHHEDYSKPFDVVWVCNACHGARHRKWKELAS